MRASLITQGYCIGAAERRGHALGLRFSTGPCLAFVVVALAAGSAVMVFGLACIGVVAGFAARHPFLPSELFAWVQRHQLPSSCAGRS